MNHRTAALLVAVALAPLGAGCRSVPEGSGFLGDYSALEPHPKYDDSWVWLKPGIDLRDYDSLMFDAIEVRLAPGTAAESLGPDVLARCAAKFHEVLVETISPYYSVVEQPGAHTLRVRLALTDVRPGTSDADVGGAGMEGEMLDAATGERLGAAMSRIEGVSTQAAADEELPEKWRGVAGAFRERARRLLDYLDGTNLGGD